MENTIYSEYPFGYHVSDVGGALLSRAYVWPFLMFLSYLIYVRYLTGLSRIPGPFLASVSNFWKIKAAWQEQMPQQNVALHKKHGPLVRIGPNMISVDDPSAMSMIYGFKPIFSKVSSYPPRKEPSRGTYQSSRPLSTPLSKQCIRARHWQIYSLPGLRSTMPI